MDNIVVWIDIKLALEEWIHYSRQWNTIYSNQKYNTITNISEKNHVNDLHIQNLDKTFIIA